MMKDTSSEDLISCKQLRYECPCQIWLRKFSFVKLQGYALFNRTKMSDPGLAAYIDTTGSKSTFPYNWSIQVVQNIV